VAPRDPRPVHAKGSGRCSECHEKMATEWEGSAHAGSARSPIYAAMRAAATAPAACDACHVPLASHAPASDPMVREGVTCDVCHTLRLAEGEIAAGRFELAVHDMIKYGPLCDAKDHYFHRMGCSPAHQRAELCAACHQGSGHGAGGEDLALYTTYDEWKAGPDAADGVQCQACHMPGSRAVVAEGEAERDDVPHHGFLGAAGDLRQQALELVVAARAGDDPQTIIAEVTVDNSGAGHAVPTGFAGHRVVLRISTHAGDGAELDAREASFQRPLLDAGGVAAPYARAIAIGPDTRLQSRERRTETYALRAPAAGSLRAELVWQPIAPELAKAIGVDAGAEVPMASVELRFGAPAKTDGKRAKLPRTVTSRRPAARRGANR
jgi:hypothetical protein